MDCPNAQEWFTDLQVRRDRAVVGWAQCGFHQHPAFILRDDHLGDMADALRSAGAVSLWDRDIPRHPARATMRRYSGVYIWFEYLQGRSVPIYVGQSADLLTRLYSHFWVPSGDIYQYIGRRLTSEIGRCPACGWRPVTCYGRWIRTADACGYTARYWLRLIGYPSRLLLEAERKFIALFNPVLNVQGVKLE